METALLKLREAEDGDVLVIRYGDGVTEGDAQAFADRLLRMGPDLNLGPKRIGLAIAPAGVSWELVKQAAQQPAVTELR